MSICKHGWSRGGVTLTLVAGFVLSACNKEKPADAYGTFEAEEVVVAGETSGRLERFAVTEGQVLTSGAIVAGIDTVQLAFDRAQLQAQRASLVAHRVEVVEQRRSLDVQREIARRTRERIDRLFAQQAATAQQRDQVERDARVLSVQSESARAGVARVDAELAVLDARLAAASDRIGRGSVRNPVAGTVLVTFVRAGEMIQAGQPLYRVANLDTLTLRAYVSGGQLTGFRIGESVTVQVDGTAGTPLRAEGRITWVSARAEFTPTPVQTREDRGDLVYAVKVRVPNPDGAFKIGMPADVTLAAKGVASERE